MLVKQTTSPQNSICSNNNSLSYSQRAALTSNPAAKQLFALMAAKKTNLCVAADVTTKQELLELVRSIGSEICLLKTHIDIIANFDWDLIEQLQALAQEHNFMIFEDRKFADIGNTVQMQYRDGIYKISSWADIVNAHTVPGPGIISGLQEIGLSLGRGLILLAQMSSKGTLANGEYTRATVAMAAQYADFVIGFISREKLSDDPRMIHFTPGVQFPPQTGGASAGDSLGQQYLTPEHVITHLGTDVIIVGRGIYQAENPAQIAREYRVAGWIAYEKLK
jgi:uridine monophosphate synthetase